MSDGEFQATPNEIAATGEFARAIADEVDAGVKALAAQVEAVLDGSWTGRAATAYRDAWGKWRDGAREVIGGLDAAGQLLQANAQSFATQESANARSLAHGLSPLNMD